MTTMAHAGPEYHTKDLTLADDFFAKFVDYAFNWHTPNFVAGEGIVLVYLVAGDLSTSEFYEAFDTDGPAERSDRIETERATRPIWPIGYLPHRDASLDFLFGRFTLPGKGWMFSDSDGWRWAFINEGSQNFTTGQVIEMSSAWFGRWVS